MYIPELEFKQLFVRTMIFSAGFPKEIISMFFGLVFSGWISKSLLGCSVLPLVFGPIQLFCCKCCFHHSGSPHKTGLKSPEKPAHLPYLNCICVYIYIIYIYIPIPWILSTHCSRWMFCPRPGPCHSCASRAKLQQMPTRGVH